MFAVLALASTAAAHAHNVTINGTNTTVTVHSTAYTTIPCESTTLTYGGKTFTVSEKTTLTLVEDCECTESPSAPVKPAATDNITSTSVSSGPPHLANGAAVGTVGAAAGVVAAVAYLL